MGSYQGDLNSHAFKIYSDGICYTHKYNPNPNYLENPNNSQLAFQPLETNQNKKTLSKDALKELINALNKLQSDGNEIHDITGAARHRSYEKEYLMYNNKKYTFKFREKQSSANDLIKWCTKYNVFIKPNERW